MKNVDVRNAIGKYLGRFGLGLLKKEPSFDKISPNYICIKGAVNFKRNGIENLGLLFHIKLC